MTTKPTLALYRIRPIDPRDRDGLTRFYASLSTDSREQRFHGAAPSIPDATARFFCGPDHEHREGLVAECFDAIGDRVIIGHVCVEPLDDNVAEMAIAVADAWQRHGVGRALLAHAIAWAQVHGIDRLAASTRCGNAAVLALVRSMGYPIVCGAPVEGTVDVDLDVRASGRLAA